MYEINNVNNNLNENTVLKDYNTKLSNQKSKLLINIKHIYTYSQNKPTSFRQCPNKNLFLRKFNQIENICQKIYTNSYTPNQKKDKDITDEIFQTRLKSINDITNNLSPKNNNNYLRNLKLENKEKLKNLVLLTNNRKKNKRCISRENKVYITEKIQVDDNIKKTESANNIKRDIEKYGSNIILKKPQIYKLPNKKINRVFILPKIDKSYIKINSSKKFSDLIPDKNIKPEDFKVKYDFYEKIPEIKKNMCKYGI